MFKRLLAAGAALTGTTVALANAASAPAAAASGAVLATAAEVGFFSAAVAFVAGFLLTWPALVVLVFLGILFEHNGARGWSVFTALVVAAVAYFFFSVSLLNIAIGAVGYVVIGLLWSFWRYKRHVGKVIEENKGLDASYKERALRNLHPKQMLGTITAWVVVWPFSMVENLVGDILNFVQDLVVKYFRGVYMHIYESAVSALK